MSKHTFIYGGPRNGSWHMQYYLTATDATLYSGTENIDHSHDGISDGAQGTIFKRVVDDSLYDSLEFADYTKGGNLFEVAMLMPNFWDANLAKIEAAGKFLVCKGTDGFDVSGIDHNKVYVQKPLADQWRSYALARLIGKFQWETGETPSGEVTLGGADTTEMKNFFVSRMTAAFDNYETYKDDSNVTLKTFSQVIALDTASPLIATPTHTYTTEASDFLSDTSFMSALLTRESSLF